jgi:hypothetical protein
MVYLENWRNTQETVMSDFKEQDRADPQVFRHQFDVAASSGVLFSASNWLTINSSIASETRPPSRCASMKSQPSRTKAANSTNLAQAILFALATAYIPSIASAQEPDQSNQEPQLPLIERSDQLRSKLSFGVYYLPGEVTYDLNFRRQFGSALAWVGALIDPKGGSQGRVGAEYDYQREWLLFIPTLQVNTVGAVMGSVYAELGTEYYGIIGFARTNLRPFNNLTFDPNDSVQLGLGHKISSYDKLYAYSIFDVRLHTHQQDTHILWRHRLDENNGITLDGLYKSGDTDEHKYIRAVGIGIYYDRPAWFWKAYYDPHVNFTRHTMVRLGVGLKF